MRTQQKGRPQAKRIGILGGTFDPIHIGHLIIAQEALARLRLDHLLFVPVGQPPHKLDRAITDPEQRVDIVRLAIADHAQLGLSRVDVDRSGPCYSVDTIRLLREQWEGDVKLSFLVGADSLVDLPTWYHPDRLIRQCQVIAVRRPGFHVDLDALEDVLPGARTLIHTMEAPFLDISSTDIRRRVREGLPIRVHGPAPGRAVHPRARTVPGTTRGSVKKPGIGQ